MEVALKHAEDLKSDKTVVGAPKAVKPFLDKLTEEQRLLFQHEYNRRKKNPAIIQIFAIFFPIQLFLLGKTIVGLLFVLTLGGLGFWWILEVFLAIPRTIDYNRILAVETVKDVKLLT